MIIHSFKEVYSMSASLKIKDSNGNWVEVPEIHSESAYEGAVRNGYVGSESDFYYMLSNFSNAAGLANTAAARAEALLSSLPTPPTTDGNYMLTVTVTDGNPIYRWVSTST